MKNNRRNYYRILQVQPDASLDIIKINYRTLLHKLRLHPDLGGENITASYINLAYATLRNSTKRAEYDRQLLNKYTIGVISKGHLAPKTPKVDKIADNTCIENSNRRNYYRILHIQADAPPAIISASYKMLVKKKTASIDLTREAFSVLSVPYKRKHYDQFLKANKHVNSSRLNTIERNEKQTMHYGACSKQKNKDIKHFSTHTYQPLITKYCVFCKTPQNQSPIKYVENLCIECSSPLHLAKEIGLLSGRFFSRSDFTTTFGFYTYWPGEETIAALSDLSPTGLCFTTRQAINKNQIIKINADQFQAIGQVKHSNPSGTIFIIGIKFLTIQFNNQMGNFMSASA